jgi:hypothetical protein
MPSAKVTPQEVVTEEDAIPIARLVVEGNEVYVNGDPVAIVVDDRRVAIVVDDRSVAIAVDDPIAVNHESYSVQKYVCCYSENAHLGLTLATVCGYAIAIILHHAKGDSSTTAILAVSGMIHVSLMVCLKFTCTYDVRVPLRGGGDSDVEVYDVKFRFYEVDEQFKPTDQKIKVILFNGINEGFTMEEPMTLNEIEKNKKYKFVGSEKDDIEKFKKSIKDKTFSAKLSNGYVIGNKMPRGFGGKRRRRRSLQKNKRKRNKKTRRKYNTLSKNYTIAH